MAVDCPHCFTYVVPKADGHCPACQQDTRDVGAWEREHTTVVIGEHSHLPEICCDCGVPARRIVRVKRSKPNKDEAVTEYVESQSAALLVLLLVLRVLLGPFAAIISQFVGSQRNWLHVSVSIVQCSECAESGPPEPLRVDHQLFTMRFVVHRNFSQKFNKLNAMRGAAAPP